jgi:hypothetical protein
VNIGGADGHGRDAARKHRQHSKDTMKDMQAHLEKLRVQTVECEMIRDPATDEALPWEKLVGRTLRAVRGCFYPERF